MRGKKWQIKAKFKYFEIYRIKYILTRNIY